MSFYLEFCNINDALLLSSDVLHVCDLDGLLYIRFASHIHNLLDDYCIVMSSTSAYYVPLEIRQLIFCHKI
jgi:hypothetical protein